MNVWRLLAPAGVDREQARRWQDRAERTLHLQSENRLLVDAAGPSSIWRGVARSAPADYMEHGQIRSDNCFPEALPTFTHPDALTARPLGRYCINATIIAVLSVVRQVLRSSAEV